MITFHNPGELDPRLITTFGVSIKESPNPIGFFGTGLKYAIATLLRTKHQVVIHSGLSTMTFRVGEDTIRGKSIPLVYMTLDGEETQLPFSVDLGKNWEPWMAYRELRCNAIDEGGSVTSANVSPEMLALRPHHEGETNITVWGAPITEVHRLQHKYFITGTPVWATDDCEIYARSGKEIFYRGVKVGDHNLPGLYTYNILTQIKLTEDRTIDQTSGKYSVVNAIESAIMSNPNEKFIEEVITAKIRTTMEGNIQYSAWNAPSGESSFTRVVRRLVAAKFDNVNAYARKVAEARMPKEKFQPKAAIPTTIEAKMLARAITFLAEHFDFPNTYVHLADNLGDNVLGLAIDGSIWVSRMAMSQGTKMLAGTIYEEHLHITRNLADESRPMQNFLLDRLMSLGEVIQGEPL